MAQSILVEPLNEMQVGYAWNNGRIVGEMEKEAQRQQGTAMDAFAGDGGRNRTRLTNSENGSRLQSPDASESFEIGRSLGAKAKNYRIELPNGEKVTLTEGTRVTEVKTIAGKGRIRQIDEIDVLLATFHGNETEWQKKKGIGFVDYQGESYKAELHWYEEPSVGKVKWKVKAYNGEWRLKDD